MTVEAGRHTTWLLDAFLEAGRLLGYPLRDPNSLLGNAQLGFAPYLFTIKDGQRLTTADAYLRPALERRENLNVALNAQVRKIIFDENDRRTAKGVQFSMNGGYSVIEVSFDTILIYRYYHWCCFTFSGQGCIIRKIRTYLFRLQSL